MANQQMLEVLRSGTESWNNWRREHFDKQPDLDFYGYGPDLGGADLGGANLSRSSNLNNAVLSGANLTSTRIGGTVFANVDLSSVIGLEMVQHEEPSMISSDTLFRSQGLIPEVFLERAGVLRIFQENFPSLVRRPLMYSSCFMSYASEDRAFAERLYTDLQQQQVPCWYASVDIETNDRFQKGINEALQLYDKLLLVLSSHSVASARVEYELKQALAKEQRDKRTVLLPIRLDRHCLDAPHAWAADLRSNRHIIDFERWKDQDAYHIAFTSLLRDLRSDVTGGV